MSRDLGQQTAARLAQEWSAPRAAGHLQPEHLQALAKRFEGLEPLVKARALLAGTLMRPEALAACREELRSLAEQAVGDDDEWVRVIGRAVGSFSGLLDLDAVVAESRLVAGTMTELQRLLDANEPCPAFRPLEELYLSPRAAAARGGGARPLQHSHFRLRKPVGSGVSAQPASLPTLAQEPRANGSQVDLSGGALGGRDEPDGVSAAAAASDAGPHQQSALPAYEQRPPGIAAPPHSPRAVPKAPAAADMFLSAKPVHRPAATDRRGAAHLARKVRTKQIDVGEAAALNRERAEQLAARRAEKAAAQEASRKASSDTHPREADAAPAEIITDAGAAWKVPSLADYLGGGSSAEPRQRQQEAGASHAEQPARRHTHDDSPSGQHAVGRPEQQHSQEYDGAQHQQHWDRGWQHEHGGGGWDGHTQAEHAHWQQEAPQHSHGQWAHDREPQGWVDHDAPRDPWADHEAGGGGGGWVDHDTHGGRGGWADAGRPDAAGGAGGWVDHDAGGGRDGWHSRERSGGASADAATHYSAPAGGRHGGGGGGEALQGADSEPESGEVEAEEGELEPSPAKRPRLDDDDSAWT